MLKLKLQYFGNLMQRTNSLEKTLMLENIEGRGRRDNRGWDGWMASLSWWTWVWVGSGSWWWTGKPGVLQSMGLQRVGHNWATELTAIEFLFVKEWWTCQHCLYSVLYLMEDIKNKIQQNKGSKMGKMRLISTQWKRFWCWKILKAKGEGSDRKWNG